MSSADRYYVYVIFSLDGQPCYVGKGKRSRWIEHWRRCHNPALGKLIAEAGGELPIVKVRGDLSGEAAAATEMALIKAIGRGDKGPLLNKTDGGQGNNGFKHSAETKAKCGVLLKGTPLSPEHRAKLRASHRGTKGLKYSDASRARMSEALSGRTLSAEHRKNIGRSQIGRTIPADVRQKIRESVKAVWAARKAR